MFITFYKPRPKGTVSCTRDFEYWLPTHLLAYLPLRYHFNHPRPSPIGLVAKLVAIEQTVICSEGRGSISAKVRDFFSFALWANFLSGAFVKVLLGILAEHFILSHSYHFFCMLVLSGKTLLVIYYVI